MPPIGTQSVAQLTREQVLNGYDECGIQFKNGEQSMSNAQWDQFSRICDEAYTHAGLIADDIVFADLDDDGVMEALVPAGVQTGTVGGALYVFKNVNGVARAVDTIHFGKQSGKVISVSGNAVTIELDGTMTTGTSQSIYLFTNGNLVAQ